jgi:RNA ligase
MNLVKDSEAFYFSDQTLDDRNYRIFNYRLASYSEFLRPGGLDCRGHMFKMCDEKPLELVSLSMEKFFNLYENPMTMDLDLSTTNQVELKADGSLISTFFHGPNLRLKSKGSLQSDQAVDAMAWLTLPENNQFRSELVYVMCLGGCVNMEWTGPQNRIVLGYDKPGLTVLNIRNLYDGKYVEYDEVSDYQFTEILNHWTQRLSIDDPVAFAQSIPDMTGVEGYVIRLDSGQRVKIKTSWYLALHHTKDSINSPRRLFEAVLEEATDDMRSLFYDDPGALQLIADMEVYVDEKYNHMVDTVERFYKRNKELSRKDYAILGRIKVHRTYFGLIMQKYVGREIDYKAFLKKQWKNLGLQDTENDRNKV